MRIKSGYVKANKNEDIGSIKAFGKAVEKFMAGNRTKFRADQLRKFKEIMIDQNVELMESYFNNFLKVLEDYSIPQPEYVFGKEIESGGWYDIPSKKTGALKNGLTHDERLAARKAFRLNAWNAELERMGITDSEVDLALGIGIDELESYKCEVKQLSEMIQNLADRIYSLELEVAAIRRKTKSKSNLEYLEASKDAPSTDECLVH